MLKKDLRKQYEQKRMQLSAAEVDELSLLIVQRFAAVSFDDIKYLHVFYPMVGRHEFNSLLLVEQIRKRYPGVNLVLPKSDLQDHSLKHILWDESSPLSMNSWGITEPESGAEIAAEEIDMVIVPLLAFDLKGNRLGYGKGFYDRFLAGCRADTKKIGVSFFPPEEFLEPAPHDIPLDICITPGKVWKFPL